MKKRSKFPYLLGFFAIALAGVAAFISVIGLSKLFAGVALTVLIMAGVMEASKLVLASYIYRFWKKLSFLSKSYGIIAMIVLMLVTSGGIYGYLSGGYSITSLELGKIDGQIGLVEIKKEQKAGKIETIKEQVGMKNDRITQLTDLRTAQETRLDSLYQKGWWNSAKTTEKLIEETNKQLNNIISEVDSLNGVIQIVNDEIFELDNQIFELKSGDIQIEVGPLKYIAKLFDTTMDRVVNFFMLFLIFVLDPLAVYLVIATNKTVVEEWNKKDDDEGSGEPISQLFKRKKKKKDIDALEDYREDVKESDEVEIIIEPEEPTQAVTIEDSPSDVTDISNVDPDSIEYVENKEGDFEIKEEEEEQPVKNKPKSPKAAAESVRILKHNIVYNHLVQALYKEGGVKRGDPLVVWKELLSEITKRHIKCSEKEVRDFLTVCNLMNITDMSDDNRKIMGKTYEEAKKIINLLEK